MKAFIHRYFIPSALSRTLYALHSKPLALGFLLFALRSMLPAEPYFQQHVHYTINCTLNTVESRITGSETLAYTNNSPDTLKEVYFRLYWNAFTYGSYWEKTAVMQKNFFHDSSGGVWLKKFTANDNGVEKNLAYEVDNTIVHVTLASPLPPNATTTFAIDWNEKVPTTGRRTGHVGRDYNIAQWYPQIATYDKYGWHREQYIGAEFHDEFGEFDVSITLPKSFIVAYSGMLLNPTEVLPDSAVKKLKASEGIDTSVNIIDYSNRIIPDSDTALVTWKCRIENARDFAWSANEHYIWDVAHWNNIAIHALYFSDRQEFWKEDAKFGRHGIKFFSEHFGMYCYPNAFCVEGVIGGGMEYPGIVFLGHLGNENTTGLYDVTVHEFGHEWYPMMMSSNETEFAFMDEGFNTFITTLAHEDFYGLHNTLYNWTTWFQKNLAFPNTDTRENNVRQYLNIAKLGVEEPIATHADHWDEPYGSGTAFYQKTATVMFMLQYVLGDSVFSKCMLEYYNRWKFKHPYPEDFYSLVMEVSGRRDLRWFFDEWFHRTYTCDYALRRVRYDEVALNGKMMYRTTVTVKKIARAIMPVDVQLELEDGTKQSVYIPAEQWMNNETEHKVEIDLPSKPVSGELNPDKRIADINRLNNYWKKIPIKFEFDNTVTFISPIYDYSIRWRPSLWFNDIDGMKLGGKLSGSYLTDMKAFTLWGWYGVKSSHFDYDVTHSTTLNDFLKWSTVSLRAYTLEGRQSENLSFNVLFGKHYSYAPYRTLNVSLARYQLVNNDYLVFPDWNKGKLTRMLLRYIYQNNGDGWNDAFTTAFEGDAIQSDFHYNKFSFQGLEYHNAPFGVRLALRLYAGIGSGNIPPQTAFYTAGGSPIDEMNADALRSRGTLPDSVRLHSLTPGGGNLRGYFNQNFSAERIYAANLEARLPNFFPVIPFEQVPVLGSLFSKFTGVLFFDGGTTISKAAPVYDKKFLFDAGYGIRFTQFPWGTNIFSSAGFSVIRFDFPLYVSNPIAGEEKFKFRWVLTVSEVL